ncbi:hypothetical protein niasHT_036078 [Heterodera trifolii]|uniref:Uncharacterized protein n=1 Tax=Heterodera trifolii TaxID=157864 RepID=A0ABD2IHK5_9BILA
MLLFSLLLANRILLVTSAHNLAEAIGSMKEKLFTIYQKYDTDFTPNIHSILETERQEFFNSLNELTNKQFQLLERLEKKWTKLEKIFLIDSPEKNSQLIDQIDSEKREELRKFEEKPENTAKLMKMLAKINRSKFEQLIFVLFNALKGTERVEYGKHFEKQTKVIRVYSIYMKYAKEKVDDLMERDKMNWKEIGKYDKKFGKFLELIVTKLSSESKEKLEEFVVELVSSCKINTSYRQKAGSMLFDYKSHYKNEMLKKIPSVISGKKPMENFVKELSDIFTEYPNSFLENWISFEKFGSKNFDRYRAFVWKQITEKSKRSEKRIEMDKFVGKLFERRQFFDIGSKLTIEVSPSLYEHSSFSYAIDVRCTDLNGNKWQKLYGSIWKNYPSHSFFQTEKSGKMVEIETVIFPFENIVCRQFDVTVKVLKWRFVYNNESFVAALNNKTGGNVYYDELPVIYGSVEHRIDLGRHFVLSIFPLLKDEESYEVKLYCIEKTKTLIAHFQIDAKMCQKECSKMIFHKEIQCPADQYDITVWKWNNAAEKTSITRKEVRMHFTKLFIMEGQEHRINYVLDRDKN